MKKTFVGILVFLGSYASLGQVKFEAKITGKHLKKVERAKNARSKLSSYKKLYSKDSIRQAKQAWNEYKKNHKDSLKTIDKWQEIKAHKKEVLLGEYELKDPKKYVLDYSKFEPPSDSVDWALQELAKVGDFKQLQQYYESYAHYDSSYLDQFKMDSIQLDSLDLIERFGLKQKIESYLPPELAKETDTDIANQMKFGELDQYGDLQKIDRSGIKDFFKKVPKKEFIKSQLSLDSAKLNFTKVTTLEKEEEGIKRKSLEGTPLKDRFFLNGNVGAQSTDPIIINTAIRIGFKWTKALSTGFGIVMREQINNRDSISGEAHGYSAFVSYEIDKGFFAYSEFQRLKNSSFFSESSAIESWEEAALVGIGRGFQITKKISFSVSLLYDLNYKQNDLNTKPLVPRFGYRIGF